MKNRRDGKRGFFDYNENNFPEYDFHSLEKGITPQEIKNRLFDIINYEKSNRTKTLRLIVGKGYNSEFGPVVKPAVEDGLLELSRNKEIQNFNLEKLNNGDINEGAFIINIY